MTDKTITVKTHVEYRCESLRLINKKGDWILDLEDLPYKGTKTGFKEGDKIEITLRRVKHDGRKKRS